MPILERDPWREQYFEKVSCPPYVVIPTDDVDAWALFPEHNWIYDRLRIAKSQGLEAAPHGVVPKNYPLFSKPIINLRGMGAGSCIVRNLDELSRISTPGHFWMPLLKGEHLSTDCAVLNGNIVWLRHAIGTPAGQGMFSHWELLTETRGNLANYLGEWVSNFAASYSGMLNIETIGGNIIEAHLRFTDQWVDLYGEGWVEALITLYGKSSWTFDQPTSKPGFSIPLFAKPDRIYHHPAQDLLAEVRAMPGISSVQITFHDGNDPASHPMPPGGMRLALVNAWDLDQGRAGLQRIAGAFPTEALINTTVS